MIPRVLAALMAWVVAATLAGRLPTAQAADLGMPAPELRVAHWVQGEPVDVAAGKGTNVYVVEFWATWCGPCRVTMPHLSALQERFRDRHVKVLGITREPLSTVKPFVARQNPKAGYTLAVDQEDQTTSAYMGAFGVGGIPHAFVIDKKGRLVWHGHPMDGLDKVLEDVVADRFDLAAVQREKQLVMGMNQYFAAVLGSGIEKARADGERLVTDAKEHPDLLNQFAWVILTHPRLTSRDVALAAAAAKAACDRTESRNAQFLDTYAKALSMAGNDREALVWQRKAVAAASEKSARTRLEQTLREYEAKTH